MEDVKEQAPWWAKFTYTFGIPAAISIYLIWVLVGQVIAKVESVEETARLHQADMVHTVKSNERQEVMLNHIYALLQQICVNTSNNRSERDSCFLIKK